MSEAAAVSGGSFSKTGAKPRLRVLYEEKVRGALMERFGYSSVMAAPRLVKISLNMGVGEGVNDRKAAEAASEELTLLAGQKAVVTRAKKSEAGFKLREGASIGARVTLRRNRMYEFWDRLVTIALPSVRDFRGLRVRSFDGRGNYAFGLREHIVFPEIDYDKVEGMRGLDVAVETTARTDEEGRALLEGLGAAFQGIEE